MSKFGHILKTSIFALGLAAFGLAPAATAMADQKYKSHQNRHNYNHQNKQHSFKRHHNNHHKFNRHSPNRHYNLRGHYRSNRHGHHGHGGDVALGVLTGGLLFYALTANQRSYNYNRSYDRKVYVPQQPVYAQPVQQKWTYQAPAQPQDQTTSSSCLQVREYQTTITVGSQTVEAYGQSCLQPDGSWKLGPAIPVPGS